MNPDPNQLRETDSGLQFDKAEFKEPGVLQCSVCKSPIEDKFYQINGQTVCGACRLRAESELGGGTPATRFATALGAGILAAIGGVLLYWAVAFIVPGNWGLIAIAAAWMIGYAVRWGSRAKGGLPYQLLAVTLTYCTIAASYVHYFLPRSRSDTDLLDYLTAFGQAAALPWTEGRSIFLWIIIAIALQQAWQSNRQVKLQIAGPFSARQSPPSAAT